MTVCVNHMTGVKNPLCQKIIRVGDRKLTCAKNIVCQYFIYYFVACRKLFLIIFKISKKKYLTKKFI